MKYSSSKQNTNTSPSFMSHLTTAPSLRKTMAALLCFGLLACQAKITADGGSDNKPFQTPPPIDMAGAWATNCTVNNFFGYYEITVIQFTDLNVKYSNYRYSDSLCTTQTYLDQRIGEVSFGKQNADQSYDIDYMIDIGQGFKQLFFDVIKRDSDKLYFGDMMASDSASRSSAANMNLPYSKVANGYVPPTNTKPDPQPINPPPSNTTFLGEVPLKLGEDNSFTASNLTTDAAYKHFRFSATTKQNLSIGSLMGSDSCRAQPPRKFQWIEVLENNTLGTPIDVPMWSTFTAEANKTYILQLTVSGLTDCFASYSFSLDSDKK